MSASPLKRRAALATLDANAMTSTTSTPTTNAVTGHGTSPTKAAAQKTMAVSDFTSAAAAASVPSPAFSSSGTKRSVGDHHQQQYSPAAKKSRLEDYDGPDADKLQQSAPSTQDSSRSRTHSPDASSVFDTSAAEDASWSTAATEPDVQLQLQQLHAAIPGSRPPLTRGVPLTREQAREVCFCVFSLAVLCRVCVYLNMWTHIYT